MDWKAFFDDLQKWMAASNQVLQRCSFDSDEYWEWLVHSLGELGNKYNNHPLVNGILSAVISFQDDMYKQSTGR
nr:hypothetical protein [Enterococcus diestrammenae]